MYRRVAPGRVRPRDVAHIHAPFPGAFVQNSIPDLTETRPFQNDLPGADIQDGAIEEGTGRGITMSSMGKIALACVAVLIGLVSPADARDMRVAVVKDGPALRQVL